MLLRADPNVSVAPLAEFPQLLNLGVAMLDVILLGQTVWIVDPHIAAKTKEYARGLICQ